jgi:3-oxoacyl-[acyl-carrier protein] reductase
MKLKDRIALITGGGAGIGRAIALLFAEEGARLIINDVDAESARATCEGSKLPDGQVLAIQADVSDSSQVKRMFAEIEERFRGLDILVNNAGIAALPSRWSEINKKAEARLQQMELAVSSGDHMSDMGAGNHLDVTQSLTDEEWYAMMGVHLNGTFFCTREALKLMSRQNSGVIINMSSVAALRGLDASPHYSAAKGGVLSFTRSVAQEVASRNIRVNAICPGFVNTAFNDPISSRLKEYFVRQTPLKRCAEPSEIAATALFLASDDSGFFTGQWLSPNGGAFIA